MPRLTRPDLDLINEALALLEADIEAEEPTCVTETDPAYRDWETRLSAIARTRSKIHDRL